MRRCTVGFASGNGLSSLNGEVRGPAPTYVPAAGSAMLYDTDTSAAGKVFDKLKVESKAKDTRAGTDGAPSAMSTDLRSARLPPMLPFCPLNARCRDELPSAKVAAPFIP